MPALRRVACQQPAPGHLEAREVSLSRTKAEHARDLEATKALREARIDEVLKAMAAGEWNAQKRMSLRDLWAVSLDCVNDYASTASSILRRASEEDRDGIRAQIVAGIESIHTKALSIGELKIALDALIGKAKVLGMLETTVQHKGLPDPEKMTAVQIDAAIRAATEARAKAAN